MRDVILFIVFFILGVAFGVAVLVLAAWMIVWNVTDIQHVGLNFWNVFWLLVVASAFFGSGAAIRK